MADRLFSEHVAAAAFSGARDRIVFFHGLVENDQPTAPDFADLEFIRSSEAGGAGATIADHRLTFANVAANAETVTVGSAGFTEVWTFAATRTNPYTVAFGANATESVTNLVAAFNADTVQNLVADSQAATVFRVRSAVTPAGDAEAGVRDLTGEASTTGDAWATTSNGAGNVAGHPEWSILARDNRRVTFRVRGLQAGDSLGYRVRAIRLHSTNRSAVAQVATGTDGSVVAGGVTFTSAGATFGVSGVRIGDMLCIIEPDTTIANTRNNGSYRITSFTATTLTVEAANPFKVTQANLDFAVGHAVFQSGTEYDAAGASVQQVPFGLPAGTAHSAATEAVDAELPGPAIEVGELMDGALADSNDGREKMSAGWFDAGADHANALAKFDDGFWAAAAADRAKFAAGFVTGAMLSIQPLEDIGRLGSGWVRWAADNLVNDTIGLGTETFTAVGGAPAAFQFQQGGGAAATLTNFVAAVNTDSLLFRAIDIGGNVAAVFARTIAGGNPAVTESTAGARTVISAANMVGSTTAQDKSVVAGSYTITAADVTALDPAVFNGEIIIAALPSTTAPTLYGFMIRTAAGALKSPATVGARLAQQGANEWGLFVDETGGAAVLAATDVITFMASLNS